jgi:hypothetical protein
MYEVYVTKLTGAILFKNEVNEKAATWSGIFGPFSNKPLAENVALELSKLPNTLEAKVREVS